METDHTFPPAEKVKASLADPSTFVAAALVIIATTVVPDASKTPAKVETKKKLQESDKGMNYGL